MKEKLKKLFLFQKFQKNTHLDNLIMKTNIRSSNQISDEQLGTIYAAGDIKRDTELMLSEEKDNKGDNDK